MVAKNQIGNKAKSCPRAVFTSLFPFKENELRCNPSRDVRPVRSFLRMQGSPFRCTAEGGPCIRRACDRLG